jgi:hypothetical protein
MAENKSNATLSVVLAILTLIVGLFAGAFLFPKTVVDNSGVVTLEEALAASNAKIVSLENSLVESEATINELKAKELIEVESKEVVVEKDYVADAVAKFMKAVEDEEDEAGTEIDVLGNYTIEEVSIRKILSDYVITINEDETIVNFNIKLKFDEDGEKSEVKKFNVVVTDFVDEDEESKVTVTEIVA